MDPQDRNALILLAAGVLVLAVIGLVAFLSTRASRGADPEFWGHDATPWYLDLFGALSGLRESREQEHRRRQERPDRGAGRAGTPTALV
ncbi:hypothetical protein [Nocardiopsis aegyptia]|uniref:Uncharacterized protein n=1 Tax=Nocardiopsis aegyptia TaxID=220378 RepID=A0A7Z0EPH7_9ACTN|nr:hypothetical protein [Nocardiopsis aegyptia]NYJ35694.1 hypothetical protein [Nocardiopsis aegyptia]